MIQCAIMDLRTCYAMFFLRADVSSETLKHGCFDYALTRADGWFLLLQVFTSTSTTVFKTFACDDEAVAGESFLRADYTLSCKTETHTFFRVYAGLMILVSTCGDVLLVYNAQYLRARLSLPPTLLIMRINTAMSR